MTGCCPSLLVGARQTKVSARSNGSKGDIDVLLVPMEDWDWSRASHDTCPQTTDAWDGRKFFGDALKEQPQLTKKRSGHIMKSFNQLQRLTWKEAP